jgi:SSS family solute:Na+ symporter
MSVVFLFGVLWRKTTTRAANLILSAGTVFSLGTGLVYFITKENVEWPHFLLLSFYIFVILAALAFIVSYFDNTSSQRNQYFIDQGSLPKPTRKVWILWIMLIVIMISLYIVFNNH